MSTRDSEGGEPRENSMKTLFALSRPFYSTDDPGGGAGNPSDDNKDKSGQTTDRSKWTQEQWEAEIGRVAKKERDEASEATKNRIKAEREEEDRKAREQKELDDSERKGEYEKAKADLEAKISETTEERDSLKAEVRVLRKYVDDTLQTEIDSMPDALKAFDPGEGAEIGARIKWLETAREAAKSLPANEAKPGSRPNPRPSGSTADQTLQEVRRSGSSRRML